MTLESSKVSAHWSLTCVSDARAKRQAHLLPFQNGPLEESVPHSPGTRKPARTEVRDGALMGHGDGVVDSVSLPLWRSAFAAFCSGGGSVALKHRLLCKGFLELLKECPRQLLEGPT